MSTREANEEVDERCWFDHTLQWRADEDGRCLFCYPTPQDDERDFNDEPPPDYGAPRWSRGPRGTVTK